MATTIPRLEIFVETTGGISWNTEFNGATSEAISYYLGKWFNVGPWEDHMVRVHRITINGITYI